MRARRSVTRRNQGRDYGMAMIMPRAWLAARRNRAWPAWQANVRISSVSWANRDGAEVRLISAPPSGQQSVDMMTGRTGGQTQSLSLMKMRLRHTDTRLIQSLRS